MADVGPQSEFDPSQGPPATPAPDPRLSAGVAAAAVSASIGQIALVLSRSPAHRQYPFADMEWLVVPAVVNGQFYVVESVDTKTGFRRPVAVATWALVSDEVDARLANDLSNRIRLRPDEWKSGSHPWLVDLVGSPEGVKHAIRWLRTEKFKDGGLKVVVPDVNRKLSVSTIGKTGSPKVTEGV